VSTDRSPSEIMQKPPAELSASISKALSAGEERSVSRRTPTGGIAADRSQLLVAVERLLPRVTFAGCQQRSAALDLLTLDALITDAMEASCGSAGDCEGTAGAILSAIGIADGAA
jgi:hypothetical protein